MSREIKFRAWDKVEQQYYYNAEYTYDFLCSSRGCFAKSFGNVLDQPERYTVEQYTGLKDKYGKEIYEGDIVEYDWYIVSGRPAYRVKELVVFDDMGARLGNDRIRNCTNVVVIGNIHESLKDCDNGRDG